MVYPHNAIVYTLHTDQVFLAFHHATETCRLAESTSLITMTSTLIPRRPVGAFRGSLLGFLGGVCAVSAVGFYTLFDKVQTGVKHSRPCLHPSQYTTASKLLLQSVEELKQSSAELQNYAGRLETVEARCKALEATTARSEEVRRVEADTKALYVRIGLEWRESADLPSQTEMNLSMLEAKRAIWGLEEDARLLLEDRSKTVRIV